MQNFITQTKLSERQSYQVRFENLVNKIFNLTLNETNFKTKCSIRFLSSLRRKRGFRFKSKRVRYQKHADAYDF